MCRTCDKFFSSTYGGLYYKENLRACPKSSYFFTETFFKFPHYNKQYAIRARLSCYKQHCGLKQFVRWVEIKVCCGVTFFLNSSGWVAVLLFKLWLALLHTFSLLFTMLWLHSKTFHKLSWGMFFISNHYVAQICNFTFRLNVFDAAPIWFEKNPFEFFLCILIWDNCLITKMSTKPYVSVFENFWLIVFVSHFYTYHITTLPWHKGTKPILLLSTWYVKYF